MTDPFLFPDPLPWDAVARPLAAAEDALARVDERLRSSPIREGWIARTHFSDAAAALWIEGELVHLEDLVLHDAVMDVRAPTHELTRAHAILRTRRRIAGAAPDWALSSAGLDALRGRSGVEATSPFDCEDIEPGRDEEEDFEPAIEADEGLAELIAAVDSASLRVDRTLAGDGPPAPSASRERDPLAYDLDWDEDACLAEWRAIVDRTRELPPTLAAALAHDAWNAIEPLQRAPGLGGLLAAALLRERGKTRAHLPCLAEGAKAVPRERRRSRDATTRLIAALEAVATGAQEGLKQHDRWLLARELLLRKLDGRRSTSKLPELIEFALSRPLISAGMIA